MSKFLKKILWATDFSEESQEALLHVQAFKKTFNAELIALHVAPDFSPALYDTASVIRGELTKRVAAFKKRAEQQLAQLKKSKNISFKTIIKEGNASKMIIQTAEEEEVDLIIMGRKGQSAIEKFFIGSIANQVLRNSRVPVLLTKKKSGNPRFKKILVPTDFSPQEEIEQDYAWKLAKGFDSALTLLYVLELHDYEFPPRVIEEMFDSVLKQLRKRKKKEHEDIKISEDVHRAINASVGIADYAETHEFDMIVISTSVHSKLERFFLGNITEKIFSYSNIPIFAIPPVQND